MLSGFELYPRWVPLINAHGKYTVVILFLVLFPLILII